MTTHNGWRSARGHIVFLLALITAFALVYALEQWEMGDATAAPTWEADPDALAPAPPLEPLKDEELAAAQAAWAYFEGNTQPDTGLVNSVADYPATTMWDTGSYLLAAIAAERLGLLPREDFDRRMTRALDSLAGLPLFDDKLPNKSYDTRTLQMTDYANNPIADGIGWSALDIGRLLVPLYALMRHYPEHAGAAGAVLGRWDLASAVQDGVMVGALPREGESGYDLVQEGRLGYEQYAARGFALLGFDVYEAARVETHLGWTDVFGVEVPEDARDPEALGAHTHTVSDPFVLTGLEYGWDTRLRTLAWRVLRAQERRFEETGLLTAVTEDHLDREPYFVYSTVVANGEPWGVITDAGADADGFRTLSAKAALGWHALYRTPYTEGLVEAVWNLQTTDGWQAGHYESLGEPNAVLAANTNAVILEALHYWSFGPIVHPQGLNIPEGQGQALPGQAVEPEVLNASDQE